MNHHYSGLGYGFARELQHLPAYRAIFGWYLHLAKVVAVAILSGVTVLVAVQLAYPASRTTPRLQIQGVKVGNVSYDALAQRLASLDQRAVTIQAHNHNYTQSYEASGMEVDANGTAKQFLSYSFRDRLKPFSLFRRSTNETVRMRYNNEKVASLASKIAAENAQAPKNATLTKQGIEFVVASHSVEGVAYDQNAVVAQLMNVKVSNDASTTVTGTVQTPAITTDELNEAIAKAQTQAAQALELVVDGTKVTIGQTELKALAEITVDEATGQVSVGYNRAAIKTHLLKLADQVNQPGVAPIVTTRDGVEVARSGGRQAQVVSVEEGITAVVNSLGQNQHQVVLELKPVTVAAKVIRTYSPTSKGLQTLVSDWQKDTGLNAGVVVKELGAPGRSASLNAGKVYTAASLYKLYVANYLFNSIQNGSIDANSQIGISRSVSSCLDAMIVVSDNACPVAIGGSLGWTNLTNFARSNGFGSTSLVGGNMKTTAGDTALFLEKLHSGSLLNTSSANSLLSAMKRQVYRSAIPKGSGVTVADKVGFVDGYWHDAGIVYHPKGAYVLAVMTYGGGPSQIADLAARINSFMNQ